MDKTFRMYFIFTEISVLIIPVDDFPEFISENRKLMGTSYDYRAQNIENNNGNNYENDNENEMIQNLIPSLALKIMEASRICRIREWARATIIAIKVRRESQQKKRVIDTI